MLTESAPYSANSPDTFNISQLQKTIDTQLYKYTDSGSPFALLDFPNHPNVGDSAIWLGEVIYFQKRVSRRPAYVSTLENFSAERLSSDLPEGTIFLHGGGNFGDMWPQHHKFREEILETFRHRQIVQLPQTLFFKNETTLDRTARLIDQHKNFVLFVRDYRSLTLAKRKFNCETFLVPDMAFWIGGTKRPIKPRLSLLMLMRTDVEAVDNKLRISQLDSPKVFLSDWLTEDENTYSIVKRRSMISALPALGISTFSKMALRNFFYENLAHTRVVRGIELLSSAEFVITDRLHVHILCILLSIPHIVLDNSYGKLSSFAETWSTKQPIAQFSSSLEDALTLWKSISGQEL